MHAHVYAFIARLALCVCTCVREFTVRPSLCACALTFTIRPLLYVYIHSQNCPLWVFTFTVRSARGMCVCASAFTIEPAHSCWMYSDRLVTLVTEIPFPLLFSPGSPAEPVHLRLRPEFIPVWGLRGTPCTSSVLKSLGPAWLPALLRASLRATVAWALVAMTPPPSPECFLLGQAEPVLCMGWGYSQRELYDTDEV